MPKSLPTGLIGCLNLPLSNMCEARPRHAPRFAFCSESELVRKAAPLLGAFQPLSHADSFIVGTTRRTLAHARGFKQLIEARMKLFGKGEWDGRKTGPSSPVLAQTPLGR